MLIRPSVIAYCLLGLLWLESWKALALTPSYSCRLSHSVKGCDGRNCLHSSSLKSRRNLSTKTWWGGHGVSKGHSLPTALTYNGLKCEVSGFGGGGGVGASLEHNERKGGLRKWLLRCGMELVTITSFLLGSLNAPSVLAATTGDVRCSKCMEEVGSSTQ